jgi:hypothetical protein
MPKPRIKKTGFTTAGSVGALAVEATAAWTGYCKTILVHFAALPITPEQIVFTHHDKNGEVDWSTEIFSDDPVDCELTDYTLLAPVCMEAGDKMTVEYPNTDKLKITCSITLEGA